MTYEILLSDEYGYFDRGVAHLDDGQDIPLKVWIQQATYGSDGVLIDDILHFESGRFPLRWLIEEDSLFFYGVDADTPEAVFHNKSSRPLRLGRHGTLAPGESKRVALFTQTITDEEGDKQ